MKNEKQMWVEKVMELLEQAGVNSKQLEMAEDYLSGESELPDFGIPQSKKIDADRIDNKTSQNMEKIFGRLMKTKKYDDVFKLYNVLFALFDSVAAMFPISQFYEVSKDEEFAAKMPREKMVVMLAKFYNESGIASYRQMKYIWETAGESFEVLERALPLCKEGNANGALAIYNTYFYYLNRKNQKSVGESGETVQKSQSKNWGILGGLSKVFAAQTKQESAKKQTHNSYTQKQAEMFQRYENLIAYNSGAVFRAITEEDRKKVSSFVKKNPDKDDIPAHIKALTGKYRIYDGPSYARIPRILLGSCAANFKASRLFRNFIRLCAYGKNFNETMECIWRVSLEFRDSFHAGNNQVVTTIRDRMGLVHADVNELTELTEWVWACKEDLLLDPVKLICWCGGKSNRFDQVLLRFADNEPDMYRKAIDTASIEVSGRLSELIKKERPQLYKKHYKEDSGKRDSMRQQLVEKILDSIDASKKAAVENYLMDGDSLEKLYGMEKELAVKSRYSVGYSWWISNYGSMIGHDDFYKRCIVLECVRKYYDDMLRFFTKNGWSDFNAEHLKELLKGLSDAGMSVARQWQVAAGMENSIYSTNLKNSFADVIKDVFSDYLQTNEEECIAAFATGSAVSRAWAIDILAQKGDLYKEQIFAYFSDSSKVVKETMIKLLSERESWMPEVLEKLASKKATERELAATVIGQSKGDYTAELNAALDKEKSSKVAGVIRSVLEKGGDVIPSDEKDAASYVKELHKGGKKRALAWAYETPFIEVHMQSSADAPDSSTVVDETYMQAILLAYSAMPVPGVNKEVLKLTDGLNQSELAQYVTELFDKWVQLGAEAKKKWVLYVAGIHGGTQIVEIMKHQIDEWAKNSRGAIAAEAVKALALNSSPTALLMVDGIARRYKYRQVRAAASKALEFAAEQLGLSTEELADRIVPDLGFNEQHERIFDYGERKFKVYITPALEIEIYDENDKKLKNMPAPGKRDNEVLAAESYAEFKQMKKQMKATVANQKLRLEAALSTERKWQTDKWRALFVANPIMHQFAISLIWGVYGEDGTVLATFRYMEDGSFNTEDEEEYQLPESGMIGLIHPIELSEESKAKWEEQLSDYEITQSVEQLGRPMFAMTEEEKHANTLERFGGMVLAAISLSGKLQTMNWYKGDTEDAGMYYSFYKEDVISGIGARINFSGAYVGDSYMAAENEQVTVYDAEFYKKASANEKEQKLTLGQLSPKYFSEIVYQLTKATATSEERNEAWRKER
ncbi:MAG: DUF4132 domain-containing protein [Lachnospiraceae bacterium]|nr:DUF4132 domain-containing protein [Lachnospiraceae bacterium]